MDTRFPFRFTTRAGRIQAAAGGGGGTYDINKCDLKPTLQSVMQKGGIPGNQSVKKENREKTQLFRFIIVFPMHSYKADGRHRRQYEAALKRNTLQKYLSYSIQWRKEERETQPAQQALQNCSQLAVVVVRTTPLFSSKYLVPRFFTIFFCPLQKISHVLLKLFFNL